MIKIKKKDLRAEKTGPDHLQEKAEVQRVEKRKEITAEMKEKNNAKSQKKEV